MQVFDIKRYSINDGPGIRITIFLKGCPLSCVWCHNPEGMSPKQSKLFTISRCIGCGRCIRACPSGALTVGRKGLETDISKCNLCGKCAIVCPAKAMEMASREMSVEEVMEEIEKERPFFEQSGGGVTICGGEPLVQSEALLLLLKACGKAGIHRVVDTSLFAAADLVLEVAENVELFLVDLKHMSPSEHKKYCGVSNELILSNIKLLAERKIPFMVRIPLIEGVNASEENLIASAEFLAPFGVEVELLPYHGVGEGKHIRLGTVYNPENIVMSKPSDEAMERARSIFSQRGIMCNLL